MSNQISVGDVLKGKVIGIKKYGAFILLPSGRSGLAHISQIAREYVKQVEDYLSIGDEVQVKVIAIQDHRISLSMKELAPLARKDGQKPSSGSSDSRQASQGQRSPRPPSEKDKMNSLEEKLRKWMKSSEERLQQLQSKQKRR